MGIVKWVLLAVLLLALLVLGLRIWFVYDTKKKRRQRLEREKRRNAMLKQKEHQLEQYRRRRISAGRCAVPGPIQWVQR